MTYIPDQSVLWCIETVMQCNRQFNYTQVRTKMTTALTNSIQNVLSQLICHLFKLRPGRVNAVAEDDLWYPAKELQGVEWVFLYTAYVAKPSKAWQI